MKKDQQFKATTLRALLLVSISLILLVSIIGFYFAQSYLKELAAKNIPQETTITTNSSAKNSSDIKTIQAEISKYQEIGNKASNFFVSSQNFQSQITNDLKTYASVSGVNIINYNFNQATSPNTAAGTAINGNSKNVIITVEKPVKFTKLIKFIKGIESNLPKMQISNIVIKPTANSKDSVDVDPITINYYVR